MKFYKPDYMLFTKPYGYDCFETISFMYYEQVLQHLQSDNKLFRISDNKVFYKLFFYGKVLSKITGMNFCSYVGCV